MLIPLGLAVLAGSILTGCESTQDKAKEIQAENEQALAAEVGVEITQVNKGVKVVGTTLLHDQYGDAIVVELQNTTNQAQVNLPILVDLRDAKGQSVYKNDIPGLDPALGHVPLIRPGETVDWVNDQLVPSAPPKSAKVKVGVSGETAPAKLPELAVSPARIVNDPNGIVAQGTVTNTSQFDQMKLVLYAVARAGGKIVAAGRGQFKNLKVGARPGKYDIFFIGDPSGADVTVTAPPSVLQ
ncbi:MAG: hypothetical protein ACRDK5_00715 [Solirubrobacterales bacterium]